MLRLGSFIACTGAGTRILLQAGGYDVVQGASYPVPIHALLISMPACILRGAFGRKRTCLTLYQAESG